MKKTLTLDLAAVLGAAAWGTSAGALTTHPGEGGTGRLQNAAHRDAFAAGPGKYAPRFGGYCAWAVSQGYTAGIVPEAWKIVRGKLYLNNSKGVQARWAKDIPGNIAKADKNWPGVLE